MLATAAVLTVALLAASAAAETAGPTAVERLREVADLVRDEFVDPELRGLDWPALRQAYARRLAARPEDVAREINALLDQLGTSHTRYYTAAEPAYYQLLAIFEPVLRAEHPRHFARLFDDGPVRYVGLGLFTEVHGDVVVVSGVLDGQPAAAAGVLRGDVPLSLDGEPFAPVLAAEDADRPHRLALLRAAGEPPIELTVIPRWLEPATLFSQAMRASASAFERSGARVGYVRIWSYAGERYHDLLEELVLYGGELSTADALVLDLRGGWGGASLAYLNLFQADIPVLTMMRRGREPRRLDTQWRKKVVALVDGSTRSGKETLAYGFRKHAIGPVVGSRTAGAVAAGKPFLLADGSLLYLAVADVLVDGEKLEGRGVEPDVVVPPDLLHAAGRDPQLEKALDVAAEAWAGDGL